MVDTKRRQTHRKVHVSLPADVYDRIERKSTLSRSAFSATLAEVARKGLEWEEQARLEEALRLDHEANEQFARSIAPISSGVASGGAAAPES